MKIGDRIAREGSSLSFEFFPAKTAEEEDGLMGTVRRLEAFRPTFVSVTYGAGGGTLKNTRQVVERVRKETSLTVMPHLTGTGQTQPELEGILSDYVAMGVENVLALRGDPPREATLRASHGGLRYARDLVRLAASFDAFSIGVAVYPEGHCESPSLDMDMAYTKEKIDAGAHFAITQMFFDNRYFYQFMDRAERAGITVPIIAGIMPIIDIAKIKRFSQMCGATLPRHLVERMEAAGSPEEARKMGVESAIEQCEDLCRNGVSYFHFYTLNRADVVSEILRNLRLDQSSCALVAQRS
ncbi:MAG: methylenetetrahydrofolate reductase [NAD(P)H] [Chloroflexi bacterium]|nr:methylenetetrahydrofolate reductase [NAD(P)H] [Chloroflexota bacterium]